MVVNIVVAETTNDEFSECYKRAFSQPVHCSTSQVSILTGYKYKIFGRTT